MGPGKRLVLNVTVAVGILIYSSCVTARTIQVCRNSGCEYGNIKTAVAGAKAWDTIWVRGDYYFEENIIIDKPLYIYTDENANVDGNGIFEIFTIKSNWVTIKGFCLQNTGISSTEEISAIHVLNSAQVSVENNTIQNSFFAILLEGAKNCRILQNRLKGVPKNEDNSGNGIHLWQCDSITVKRNLISGHRDGIYLEFVTNSLISGNASSQNLRYGLHFMFSHSDVYEFNEFAGNGAGVAVMFSKNVDMYHNIFKDNWGNSAFGLLLKEIKGGHIDYNIFSTNTSAAYFEGSSNLSLHKNVFTKNGWALKIQASCENIQIDSNNFIQNTFDIATNGTLVLNNFNRNYWDKYEGYDLKKDGTGDIPYHPVSLYSMITERNPSSLLLMRSFIVSILDRAEKVIPSITPENLKDEKPLMKPIAL